MDVSLNSGKPFTEESLKQHMNDVHSGLECNRCGRTRSRKSKPFTEETLKQHQITCTGKKSKQWQNNEFDHPALEMADLIAGDENDGVYWGIAQEFGYFG